MGFALLADSGNLVKLDDEIVIEATGNMSMPAEPKRSPPTI